MREVRADLKSLLTQRLAERLDDIESHANHIVQEVTEHQRLPHWGQSHDLLASIGARGGAGYLQVPVLHQRTVMYLLEYMRERDHEFAVNPEEESHCQMQELVLEAHITAYRTLDEFQRRVLRSIWILAFGLHPNVVRSIQFAKYAPGPNANTAWHYDQDSDCTTTIALANGQGGGMEVWPGIAVPKSVPGVATMFRGRTLLHRSRPVLEGERKLLVFWTDL